jgi:hypothetical protein
LPGRPTRADPPSAYQYRSVSRVDWRRTSTAYDAGGARRDHRALQEKDIAHQGLTQLKITESMHERKAAPR